MIDYDKFEIIIDTREQQPWVFDEVAVANHKLDTGDYSVKGYENLLCIERKKSVNEIAQNITEQRFKDVIERMSQHKYSFLILEFDLEDIYRYPIGSNVPKKLWDKIKINSSFIIKNLLEIQLMHGIHVLYCGDPTNASKMALSIMKKVFQLEYYKIHK